MTVGPDSGASRVPADADADADVERRTRHAMEYTPAAAIQGGVPPGISLVAVASYATYKEAERAVDHLSDQGFPVQRSAIAGRGLSSFEQVTGRLTTWRAGLQSALSGAVIGALFGWIFGLFNWISPVLSGLVLAFYGAIFGAVVGGLLGFFTHAMTGGRRDFSSVSGLRADHYDVLVDASMAPQAAELLQTSGAPGTGTA